MAYRPESSASPLPDSGKESYCAPPRIDLLHQIPIVRLPVPVRLQAPASRLTVAARLFRRRLEKSSFKSEPLLELRCCYNIHHLGENLPSKGCWEANVYTRECGALIILAAWLNK